MSEQRLIDVDALKEKEQYIPCGNGLLFHGVTAATIDAMPTIGPETLPIVRELQEKLERVTAERDAAIKDRAELADFKLTVCEQFCFGDRKHNIPPCEWNRFGRCKLREWSVPVAENATTDTSTEEGVNQ